MIKLHTRCLKSNVLVTQKLGGMALILKKHLECKAFLTLDKNVDEDELRAFALFMFEFIDIFFVMGDYF